MKFLDEAIETRERETRESPYCALFSVVVPSWRITRNRKKTRERRLAQVPYRNGIPLELSSQEIRDRHGPDPKTNVAALFAHCSDTGARPWYDRTSSRASPASPASPNASASNWRWHPRIWHSSMHVPGSSRDPRDFSGHAPAAWCVFLRSESLSSAGAPPVRAGFLISLIWFVSLYRAPPSESFRIVEKRLEENFSTR